MTGASPDLLPERAVQRHDPIHQEQRQGQKQEEKLQLCQVHGRKNLQLESSQQLYVGLFLGGNIVWPHAVNMDVDNLHRFSVQVCSHSKSDSSGLNTRI